MLGQIEEEAEALDDMVRNLLAITRIDSGFGVAEGLDRRA
jgi:K+-sensing histidine kinase KdpD